MSGAKNVFDTAMGVMGGIVGSIGGLTCMGIVFALMIIGACCVMPVVVVAFGGG